MLDQPCNKSDIFVKLVTSCQQVWNNLLTTLEQAVRTHLVDGLSADLLQVVRFLRVYSTDFKLIYIRKRLKFRSTIHARAIFLMWVGENVFIEFFIVFHYVVV